MNNETQMILQEIREMKGEMAGLREEMKGEVSSLHEEMKGEISSLREEMKGEISSLREEVTEMKADLEQEIRDGDHAIRLILENEMKPQIRIIAESHLNLDRKLNEVLEIVRDNEILHVRVGHLEKEVDQIKRQLVMTV